MKHRKFTKQQEKDMKEIVDYYMQFVTGEHFSIRESLEYFWKCMSDYTIEDYLEVAREGKANMNNEPVAWILNGIIHEFDPSDWAKEQYPDQDVIPLYTHPAKTLTDEEIAEVFDNTFKVRDFDDAFLKFAKAILRKAQEK